MKLYCLIFILLLLPATSQNLYNKIPKADSIELITYSDIDSILSNDSEIIEKDKDHWEFKYKSRKIFILFERDKDRIKMFTAITRSNDLTKNDMKEILTANFENTYDIRYSFYKGWLWSNFSHKISELTINEFIDARSQIFTLAKNYGSYYMSIDPVWDQNKKDNLFKN
ncbi:MAG: hypothetical protein CMF96_04090 [Candidatus Marinimicrobia bacterium]|nr:hypothetical protein [Candidatus Neomarinimicrobiota bacterium]|tara:strand:- start:711 stop:1217 length:507 start_codon:yes stop_codon:yes gene_type:complete